MAGMPPLTPEILIGVLENTQAEYHKVFAVLDINTPAPGEGQWTPRQTLSHVIGVLNRIPFQGGFFTVGAPGVAIEIGNPYWLPMYENAPKESFVAALDGGIAACKAYVKSLPPELFFKSLALPRFGDTPLAGFMFFNFQSHINEMHLPQMRAFLK